MLKRCTELITLSGNYLLASVFYFGLGLLVLGLTPTMPSAKADITCPWGQVLVWFGEFCECQCPDDTDD